MRRGRKSLDGVVEVQMRERATWRPTKHRTMFDIVTEHPMQEMVLSTVGLYR